MVFVVRWISAGEGTFLARVVNRSLWRSLLEVKGRIAEEALGPAERLLSLGEGLAMLGEVKGLLFAVTTMLDEALVTADE